jgi:HSP20 family protein
MFWNDDVFEDMRRMQQEIGRACYNSESQPTAQETKDGKELSTTAKPQWFRIPRVEVNETDKALITSFELPGVDRNDVELNVTEEGIEVKVEQKQEKEAKGKESYSYSAARQSFYRHIPLPRMVDATKAKAEYKNGILRVEIPKTAKSKVKKLEIK